jgi:hypothetical protein
LTALAHASNNNSAPYVGGNVVADAESPLGFYFDPATATGAEVVAEGFQIPLSALVRNPDAAQAAGHPWYIAGVVEQTIPGTESARAAVP